MTGMYTAVMMVGVLLGCDETVTSEAAGGDQDPYPQVGQLLVRMDSDILTVDASGHGDATDIQSAVDLAHDGDVVRVLPGTYVGAVIDKQVALIGGDGVNVTAMPDGIGFYLPAPRASGSMIRGFSFDGVPYPVRGVNADDVTVSHLSIQDFVEGIGLNGCNGWAVEHNVLTASEPVGTDLQIQMHGISVWTVDGTANDNLVAFNRISYNGPTPTGASFGNWGISLAGYPGTEMEGNRIVHNQIRFFTGQWFSGGIGVGDASLFYGGPPVVVDNNVAFNDTRGSTTWETMFFAVSLEDNSISANLGATWYTDNPFLGEYTNIDTGENRSSARWSASPPEGFPMR
ncbi:MAG: hypothetical protein PVI01_02395 [Gemmatimonadales bacterium]|jgi:hypothetical protein